MKQEQKKYQSIAEKIIEKYVLDELKEEKKALSNILINLLINAETLEELDDSFDILIPLTESREKIFFTVALLEYNLNKNTNDSKDQQYQNNLIENFEPLVIENFEPSTEEKKMESEEVGKVL